MVGHKRQKMTVDFLNVAILFLYSRTYCEIKGMPRWTGEFTLKGGSDPASGLISLGVIAVAKYLKWIQMMRFHRLDRNGVQFT